MENKAKPKHLEHKGTKLTQAVPLSSAASLI